MEEKLLTATSMKKKHKYPSSVDLPTLSQETGSINLAGSESL